MIVESEQLGSMPRVAEREQGGSIREQRGENITIGSGFQYMCNFIIWWWRSTQHIR